MAEYFQNKIQRNEHFGVKLNALYLMLQISDWFQNSGNIYLSRTELGDSVMTAQSISTEHDLFEQDSMRIQGELLQLVRTSEQLSHTTDVDITTLRQRLQGIDDLAQDFMLRMDARRRNIATAINFYRLAAKVRRLWSECLSWHSLTLNVCNG